MGSRKGLTQSPSSMPCANNNTAARRISHFIDRFYNNLIMLVLVLCILIVAQAQVNHSPLPLNVSNVYMGANNQRVPVGSLFTESFVHLGYDFGGAVYETNRILSEEQAYNKSLYRQSSSCKYFNSKLKMHILQYTALKDGASIQALAFLEDTQEIFTIQNNNSYLEPIKTSRYLVGNKVNTKGISEESKRINLAELKLNTSEELDIMLMTVNKIILLTDGVKIMAIQANNFNNYWQLSLDLKQALNYTYAFAAENQLLDFKMQEYDRTKDIAIIHLFWNAAIRTFEISDNFKTATLKVELLPPTGTQFHDVTASDGKYWALVQEYFLAYRPNLSGVLESSSVRLQSKQCFRIYKHEDTVHMICKEEGLHYVGQYFLNESFTDSAEALYLNRYYTEVDDAKDLLMFGPEFSQKLLIIGDEDFQIMPYAVNRQALIQAVGIQKAERYKAFNIKQVYLLSSLSNLTQTYAIGLTQGTLALLRLVEEPPEIECMFNQTAILFKNRWILVQVNSSSCIANFQRTQLESICSYTIPYSFEASWIEVEAEKHTTLHITGSIILLAILIAFVGLAITCKNKVKQAGASLQKKLLALRKDKEMKPL